MIGTEAWIDVLLAPGQGEIRHRTEHVQEVLPLTLLVPANQTPGYVHRLLDQPRNTNFAAVHHLHMATNDKTLSKHFKTRPWLTPF